ncbi:MAG: LuxR C-terminal-related transcriptional regulator [Pseudomonadota bacterium]
MRRVALNETFHGTAAGQVPNSKELEDRFALTERQAQCAALLRAGIHVQSVAEVLGISASTLETHLADLRRRFTCDTTAELRSALDRLISDQELAAFHCWPTGTNAAQPGSINDGTLASRLRVCVSVEQALDALRDSLHEFGVLHIYYCFIPHSVQGVLRGDLIDTFLAPDEVRDAFTVSGGLISQPITHVLFDAPMDVPIVSLDPKAQPPELGAFYATCCNHGATHMMAMGFPSGPGFVGLACTLQLSHPDFEKRISSESETIRGAAITMHAALLTNGALAAKFRLTIKERNALSSVALGKRTAEIAGELAVSERALTKLLASARSKLNARTNTEAAVKAALVNALVFL